MRKFLKEWAIILGVFGILYLTGLHTEVIAFAQRIVLSTGFITPKTLDTEDQERANYNVKFRSLSSGEILDLNSYKNKVIFINFWASWCGPCIAEMPGIQNLYNKVDTTQIKFLMISLDSDPDNATKFIDKKGFSFPVYYPASRLPLLYDPPAIPTTFVIDQNGLIVSKTIGMANYNKKSFIKYINQLSQGK